MDEEIEQWVIAIRADTRGFARDVAEMRGTIEGPLEAGADRAGRAIEGALLRAVRTGKLGFEDLRTTALAVLGEIAAAALREGMKALGGGGSGGGGSAEGQLLAAIVGTLAGSPGRATGGPVSPGRP